MNRNNPRRTDNQNGRNPRIPSQQPASPVSRWNNNQPGYGHGQQTQQQDQRQRDRDLVDYPFTVEYVNRRNPNRLGGSMSTSRLGIGAGSQSQNDDENLIDYPFTVEFVSNTNNRNPPEKEKIPDLAPQSSNQHSFQSTTQQQQRYQPCNHHYH